MIDQTSTGLFGHFILTVFGDFYPALNGDFRPPLTTAMI